MEVRFAPERAAVPRRFGDFVLVFFNQSLAAERKHHRVHSETSGGQSATVGKRSP